MTTSQAVLWGALLIAASVIIAQGSGAALAYSTGPYQLMRHSNPSANAGVFRIDSSSGEVSYCYVTQSNELLCSKAVK